MSPARKSVAGKAKATSAKQTAAAKQPDPSSSQPNAAPVHSGRTAAQAVDEQLARYRAMRDFSTTAEPSGAPTASAPTALPFCIQKHAATRLHYDFRLGWHGVLKSWAVAKGPSYVVRDKRLAVQVEDHPMEYGGFEGTIPKGQYGGGTVLLWDQGTWEPQAAYPDIDEGLRAGSLKIVMHGEKMHGKWALIRMGGHAAEETRPNWLLIKEHDEYEQPADAPAITDTAPDSVVTGRSLEQIAAADDHTWNSKPSANKAPANHSLQARNPVPTPHPEAAEVANAPKETFPPFVPPQLATPARLAPKSADWLHELKLDGYRVQAHLERRPSGPKVTLYTRNGLDWTHRMAAVAKAVADLPAQAAILDGEVVVLDAEGKTSFSALQAAFDEGAPNPLTYVAFDLLHLDGHILRGLPLQERKAALERLLCNRNSPSLVYGQHATGVDTGPEIFSQACSMGAEGIISKLATARYTAGRGDNWLKLKCVRRQEFVIGGFVLPGNRGAGLGSLLLGYYEDGKLIHCGRAGTGFTQATQRMVRAKVEGLRTDKSPYSNKLAALARKDAIWVRPELVCEVEFATWTGDGLIRHASFQGLREDKAAKEVVREDSSPAMKGHRGQVGAEDESGNGDTIDLAAAAEPDAHDENQAAAVKQDAPASTEAPDHAKTPSSGAAAKRGADTATPAASADKSTSTKSSKPASISKQTAAAKAGNTPSTILGTRLTHPDKILDPTSGVTKQQLALYYEAIAPALLPHIAGRPASIVRCPDGATKQCFFQKHAVVGLPKAVHSTEVPDKKTGKPEAYITIDTAEALVSLAQLGVLEIHPWGSRNDSLDHPDLLIFDLDPDETLPWPTLAASAQAIRAFLQELKLESFVKTTGGKGLHIVAPIRPAIAWPEIKLFCRGIALAIESTDPSLYLIKMTKAARTNRIFVDYLRNERGSTAVAPYSPRARAGMRVAVPLAWDELDKGMPTYAVANFESWRARLDHDPWRTMHTTHQSISPEVLAAVLDAASKSKA